MVTRHLITVTLVCTLLLLFSAPLSAQEQALQETSFAASVSPAQNPVSSTNMMAADTQAPAVTRRGSYFYASAKRHPLTPRDVSMREAVQFLGIDKHRFVLCELKNGTRFVGGIGDIQFAYFRISQGIMNGREINYSDLKEAPRSIPAVSEHFANGLKWTGFVAVCVALSPLVIALYPLVLAGLISD